VESAGDESVTGGADQPDEAVGRERSREVVERLLLRLDLLGSSSEPCGEHAARVHRARRALQRERDTPEGVGSGQTVRKGLKGVAGAGGEPAAFQGAERRGVEHPGMMQRDGRSRRVTASPGEPLRHCRDGAIGDCHENERGPGEVGRHTRREGAGRNAGKV